MKKSLKVIGLAGALALCLLLSGCYQPPDEVNNGNPSGNTPALFDTMAPTATVEVTPEVTVTPGPMDAAQELADYIFEHGELPENYIRKKDAEAQGWKTTYRYVGDIGPGITIGGDYFGNYEQKLPVVKGRKSYEADCYYEGGPRNEYRIIYSNDGHVWYTGDHYNTFTELFPTNEQ